MLGYIRNPDLYHGENKKSNFFEGWYFKLVHPKKELIYAFIPGIFLSDKREYSHSFIQVIKAKESSFEYIKFEKDDFRARKSEFHIDIGENSFSLNKMKLNIKCKEDSFFGTLYFKDIVKWPDSFINPGSMGFYNYLNFMQCYSQVCALHGNIVGSIRINHKIVDFTGGKLYVEKNWGKNFPYSYIWIQGNCFENGEVSLSCSIGHVPFLFTSFTGFLIGIYVNGEFYKFTTINRSTISINFEEKKLFVEASNKDYFLKVEVLNKEGTFMNLYAPRDNSMVPIARESLQGSLIVNLYDKKKDCMIFKGKCSYAGIEFSGDYKNLV
ncbi:MULTISPECIES: tocopherol cyclase family protein [Clostridium]|uniref:Tocopherol cyclase n=2 Tax=Clostridium TaxID=1485 RepID=A0A151AMP5_9CLOT|nr:MULTISPECIES: tocopherol cyclase family protein [Clostridium]KYH28904.1 hypothetical protein CLCOL_13440 [Clostridium colicanis DSM 13634]MBE6044897.1 hypothetical protein [Clostridium thermopalmarium]PRR73170.1 hypothetical protein CPAL_12900 [Clostridium thermopalmarium DSM 5974]PVZ25265.1 tocopherol cyclase-like protein [Clostridium thermopalmarium DSM 5974]